MTDAASNSDHQQISVMARLASGFGLYTAVIALLAMPVLWFAFTRLAVIAEYDRTEQMTINALCAWCVEHGAWAPMLALPALVHGVLVARRGSRLPVASILLGTGLLALPAAVTLWCFLMLVMRLYEVRPL